MALFDFNITLRLPPEFSTAVDRILAAINARGILMSAALDRLTTEVAETKTAIDSALALITGLAQQIRDIATDPVALNALADELDAKQAEIAAAVEANMPAE